MAYRLLECQDVLQLTLSWLPSGRPIRNAVLAHRSFSVALSEMEPCAEQLDTIVDHRFHSLASAPLADRAATVRYHQQLVELAKQQRQAGRDAIVPNCERFDGLQKQIEAAVKEPMKAFQEMVALKKFSDLDAIRDLCTIPLSLKYELDAFFAAACYTYEYGGDPVVEFRQLLGTRRIFDVFGLVDPVKLAQNPTNMEKLEVLMALPAMDDVHGGSALRAGRQLRRISRVTYDAALVFRHIEPMHAEHRHLREKMAPFAARATRTKFLGAQLETELSLAGSALNQNEMGEV